MQHVPTTLLSIQKLQFLINWMNLTIDVPGVAVECGVYQGGSLLHIWRNIGEAGDPKRRTVIGFDPFLGLPTPHPCDKQTPDPHAAGDFGDVDVPALVEFFDRIGVPIVRVGFCLGFPSVSSDLKISFAHVDVDFYTPTMDTLSAMKDMLEPGGRLVVDDYGWSRTPGVKYAVDALVARGMFDVYDKSVDHQIVLG